MHSEVEGFPVMAEVYTGSQSSVVVCKRAQHYIVWSVYENPKTKVVTVENGRYDIADYHEALAHMMDRVTGRTWVAAPERGPRYEAQRAGYGWIVWDTVSKCMVRPSGADSHEMGSEENAAKFATLMNEREARLLG